MDEPVKVTPLTLTPHTLWWAGAITTTAGVVTTLATARPGRRWYKLAPLATVIGTGAVIIAEIRRACDLTKSEQYQIGFCAGEREGRRKAKPTIVPLCRCQNTNDKPRTKTS